ncbi:hypothetical protein PINS_up013650 [Pythium insidiosum]|nr:hypothetical protein PINS_up013650 [Pythium insidiosum]
MPPDFDPNVYNPDHPGMMPPPMMMGRHGFYPYGGGRGRGGRASSGYHHSGGRHGAGLARQDSAGGEGSGADSVNAGNIAPTVGAKTTLRVSNVDPKYINMTKLSLHFSKFGNVVNVQMRPNHRCAYVQYATEDEAKKAFHSPIPVCNNRFIEVKWAKYDARDPQGAPSEKDENSTATASTDEASEESGATGETGATSAPAASTEASAAEKEMTTEELRAAALEQGRKVLEEKRELLEKQRQLMKQKEELLKRQLAQQKELLERMSQNSASVSAADKRELLNKITALSEELKALQPARRDSGDQQSKLSGLKAELSALEAQANGANFAAGGRGAFGGRGGRGGRVSPWGASAGVPGRGFYGRGPGGRGRGGRGSFSNTLDNRTTIVKIEQLPDEARDPSVLEQHFGNFGAIERVVMDENQEDRAFIKFKDRYSGQTALTRGTAFGAARLQLEWVEAQDAPSQLGQSSSSSSSHATEAAATDAAIPPSSNGETQEVSASA